MSNYFDEIIGYENIKKELMIISDMLNNPEEYKKLGVFCKEGVLLYGFPGTGKTTMAKCLLKSVESNRKSYIIRKNDADGDFIKYITDTFNQAKSNAPAIILLDDLDKFSDNEKALDTSEFVTVQSCIDDVKDIDVFVIATCNDDSKLPNSLKRSGRLGKTLYVSIPIYKEAVEIIKYYINKSGRCADDIDIDSIAAILNGESCATLENIINNAAILAAYNRQETVTLQNIVDVAIEHFYLSRENMNEISDDFKRRVAYHEAGHTVISELLRPGSVAMVSIRDNCTYGGDFGFTKRFYRNQYDQFNSDNNTVDIKIHLAGKAIVELIYGVADIGVTSDLSNAYMNAETIIGHYASLGFYNFSCKWNGDDSAVNNRKNIAISFLLEKEYMEVKKMLAEHRELVDKIVDALMEKTTLVYSEIQEIIKPYRE